MTQPEASLAESDPAQPGEVHVGTAAVASLQSFIDEDAAEAGASSDDDDSSLDSDGDAARDMDNDDDVADAEEDDFTDKDEVSASAAPRPCNSGTPRCRPEPQGLRTMVPSVDRAAPSLPRATGASRESGTVE